MSKHIATAIATTVLWGVILAQAASPPVLSKPPPTGKNDQRATTTPASPPAPSSPTAGAVLCANNPFCLPPHMRLPQSTSGEAY